MKLAVRVEIARGQNTGDWKRYVQKICTKYKYMYMNRTRIRFLTANVVVISSTNSHNTEMNNSAYCRLASYSTEIFL